MGRRHPVSQEAGYSAAVLVVTLAYGQRNALTRRDDAARPAVAPFCRNGARLTRRDDALRRPGGTGTFQSVGAAEGQPLPLSRSLHPPGCLSLFHWRMPGLLINALTGVCKNGLGESRLGVFRFCRLILRRTGLFVRYAFRRSPTICNALRLPGVFP